MGIVIYADFTSPWCYLASRRVDALAAAAIEVDWRAVEWDRRVPATGLVLGPPERAALERKMAAVADLATPDERLLWTTPRAISRTEAAVSGYAEAYGAGVGADVRRVLYTAYWEQGLDIGSPEMLRRLLAGPILRGRSRSWTLRDGLAVSPSGGPITTEAWRRIRAWRYEWTQLGTDALPVLLADGEPPSTGESALRWLEKEMAASGVKSAPDLPDPARYPEPPLRPPKEWVSRVGGTWAHAWMPSPLGSPASRTPAARG
jgi:hypothetical protein